MKSLMLVITLASAVAAAETGTFTVKGMHCSGCKESVTKKVCEGEAAKGAESCTVNITDAKKEMGEIVIVTKAGTKINEAAVTAGVKAAGDEYKVTKVQIKEMIAKDMKDGAAVVEGAPGTETKTETAETKATDAEGKTTVTTTTKKIVKKMAAKDAPKNIVGATNRNNSTTTESTTGTTTITPEKK